ncbi:MAG: class I SAM-dependent methyltransferase, partial [Elusimicrobiales bacterium]
MIDRLKKHFRNLRSLKVLEIGFGHGYLLKRLCDEGLECYGIDISVSAVNNAIRIGLKKDRLFLGDFAEFNFNSRFDVIIMNGVLEELRDPLFVMDKIKNITSRNSVIIIRTKNASFHRFAYKYLNFFSFLIKSAGVFASYGFTYKSIVILLSKYDFEIEDVYLDLTKGDPYKQFSFSSFLGFIKKVYYFISLLFFKLSLKHILISPSFMVFAVRKR